MSEFEVAGESDAEWLTSSEHPSFVGRQAELSVVLTALGQTSNRVLTICGLPGIGKTRLAVEVARRLTDDPAHAGVDAVSTVFISLAGCDDDLNLAATFAGAYATQPAADVGQAVSAAKGAELVILDSAEYLSVNPDQLGRLTADRGRLPLVVTSVRPLGLADEHVLVLGPLSLTGEDREAEAVQLFLDRATAASVSFRRGTADAALVNELCHQLDGNPLAIELAAARVRGFPLASLVAELRSGSGIAILRRPGRGGGRHGSMRQALDRSCDLLEPDARQMLSSLSVFSGAFTPAAAVALAGVHDALDPLSALAEVGFVRPGAALTTGGSFELPALIRRYARDRLAAEGRHVIVERRHIELVVELGRTAAAIYHRGDQASALELIEPAWPEISVVIARLLADGRGLPGLQLAVDSAPYLLSVGSDLGALARIERLIELVRRTDSDSPVLTLALLWSAVLTRLSTDARFDPEWVRARLAEGTERARSAGDHSALLLALEVTALSATVTGDIADAGRAVAEGLDRTSDGRHEGARARFEVMGSMIAHHQGDLDAAVLLAVAAVKRAVRRGDRRALVRAAIAVLGLPEPVARPAAQLLPRLTELIESARQIRDRHAESFLVSMEANRRLLAGDDVDAAEGCAQHLTLLLDSDEEGTIGLGFSLSTLIVIAARRRDSCRAAELYGCIEHLDEAVRLASTPEKRTVYAHALSVTRAALGERQWLAGRARGATLDARSAARAALAYARAAAATTQPREPDDRLALFRRRELDVLRAMAAGKTNKQIAADLGLTPKTVMHYASAVYDKLEVSGRAAATAWAVRHGLVDDTG